MINKHHGRGEWWSVRNSSLYPLLYLSLSLTYYFDHFCSFLYKCNTENKLLSHEVKVIANILWKIGKLKNNLLFVNLFGKCGWVAIFSARYSIHHYPEFVLNLLKIVKQSIKFCVMILLSIWNVYKCCCLTEIPLRQKSLWRIWRCKAVVTSSGEHVWCIMGVQRCFSRAMGENGRIAGSKHFFGCLYGAGGRPGLACTPTPQPRPVSQPSSGCQSLAQQSQHSTPQPWSP